MRSVILVLVLLATSFMPAQAFNIALDDVDPNIAATASASDAEKAKCPQPGVWGWRMRGPGGPRGENISVLTSTVINPDPVLSIVAVGKAANANLLLPLFENGRHRLSFECGRDFDNTRRITNMSFNVVGETIDLSSIKGGGVKAPKVKKPKPIKLPGASIAPEPDDGTLFNLRPDGKTFNIDTTIEPSQDKKIFRAKLRRSFRVNIKNNGVQNFTFVLIDLKTQREVRTTIPVGESDDILFKKGNVQLNILRVDKEEGVPANFDVMITEADTGTPVANFADLLGEELNLTGEFAAFRKVETIKLVMPGAFTAEVEKRDGNFDIKLFQRRGKKKIEIQAQGTGDPNRVIYDIPKAGRYIVELTPREERGDYEVNIKFIQ